MENLARVDPEIAEAILNETRRQGSQLEMIASENFVSEAVLEAMGTVLAAEELELKPWISGRVEFIHPGLTPGGHLQKGEVVLELNRAVRSADLLH